MRRKGKMWSIVALLGLCLACKQNTTEQNASVQHLKKGWFDHEINLNALKARTDSFIMYSNAGEKVGYMSQTMSYDSGRFQMYDISRFDDGSIIEYASFGIDTASMKTNKVNIDLKSVAADAVVNLDIQNNHVKGKYELARGEQLRTIEIDSVYHADIVRCEIYMLINAVEWRNNTQLNLKVLAPMSMRVSNASLTYKGDENIVWNNNEVACKKVELRSDGVIPENDFWISKSFPSQILKVRVLNPELEIVLESSRS